MTTKVSPSTGKPGLIVLPKVGEQGTKIEPMPPTVAPGAQGNPLDALSGFLDGEIMGIPVKYLAIGLAAFFFLKKR